MPKLLDFESRSRANLKKIGGRLYWEDPSTEPLCCAIYDTNRDEWGLWLPGDPCPFTPDDVLAAHNMMGFDRFGLARLGWRNAEAPGLIDTSELARTAGLPGALDELGKRLLGLPKDKEASRFTKSLSRPSKAKKRLGLLPDITPEVLDRVVRYCVSDVEIMQHGWPLLAEWVDLEAEISRVDRIVNDRGIRFDVPLARRLLEEDARNATIALEAEARNLRRYGVTMGADRLREIVASPQQFGEWSGLENAQKETVERVLVNAALYPDEDDIQFAAIFCRARQAIASIARGKLEAGLARVSKDGRLRDSHRYYGAHTGRWSGRGMQLQNMPRPEKRFEEYTDEDICALAEYVMAGGHVDAGEIDLLLRACLFARPRHKLLVSDFSGVEARGNAWAAGDSNAIDVFLSGKDAYKVMAAKIFGIDLDDVDKIRRQVGKIAELACGYGMGGEKFGWTAAKNGANLEALGIDPYEVVTAWRTQHRPIVQLWYALERGMLKAVSGEENTVADLFTFTPSSDGSDVAMFLPSGRPIVYNAPRVSRGRNNRPRISYHGHKGRQDVYGGLLCENAIQGLSRCLMARALVMAEDAGLDPVLHVHDEIVCEVPEQGAEEAGELLHAIMCDLPEWATGFPIGADGHEGERYRK